MTPKHTIIESLRGLMGRELTHAETDMIDSLYPPTCPEHTPAPVRVIWDHHCSETRH